MSEKFVAEVNEERSGKRNDGDMQFGGNDQLSPEQLSTAEYLLGGDELSLETEGMAVKSAKLEAVPVFESAASRVTPETTRAEKNDAVKANLLTKLIQVQLEGNTAEETRLRGVLDALEERIKEGK